MPTLTSEELTAAIAEVTAKTYYMPRQALADKSRVCNLLRMAGYTVGRDMAEKDGAGPEWVFRYIIEIQPVEGTQTYHLVVTTEGRPSA